MKKIFALLLALVMALALVACGQKEDNIGGETKDDQTQTDGQSVDLRAAYEAGIKQVQEELAEAVRFAEESPAPAADSVVQDVYSDIVEEVRAR